MVRDGAAALLTVALLAIAPACGARLSPEPFPQAPDSEAPPGPTVPAATEVQTVSEAGSPVERATRRRRGQYSVEVYLDRFAPMRAVAVDDFRVNETSRDTRGVQYVQVQSADGTVRVPFDAVREIAIRRWMGRSADAIRYEATVTLRDGGDGRTGRLDLSSMRGTVGTLPWHVLLAARDDGGENLYRIVFAE